MNSPRAYGMNKSIRRSNLQTPARGNQDGSDDSPGNFKSQSAGGMYTAD